MKLTNILLEALIFLLSAFIVTVIVILTIVTVVFMMHK